MKTITVIRHEKLTLNIEKPNFNQIFDVVILSSLKNSTEILENPNIETNNLIYSDLFKEYYPSEIDVRLRAQNAFNFLKDSKFNNIAVVTHLYFSWHLLEQCGLPITSLENSKTITFNI